MAATAKYIILKNLVFNIMIDISIVSIFITTKQKTIETAEIDFSLVTSPPIGGGRGIVMPMSVCVFVCVCVCLSVFSQNFKV